ncbi:hypothetical protein SERLA73DRAFT_144703 [Serpula lacrymans var. lacrymans S7.3]|uniref:CCL2-like lectin domain-containing protein n=2 Tax=Serpula lacrymans var. lacrymans TaxID=341189 RepID=F8QC84_SERL3|nr:uncharacterized protein SERLADRAFT_402189 [Serpula lacrymans var. lacrymans S7.9]EGN94203.1 hypothetical protein SERLA73DRAFT_144703 [Serpula lacrymans var. lacrymans S7.3]EGO19628.1 hypothetical protein SERLADRAFT_402189 [Serpula lacrymans var. lacrymans S7.9]
MSKPSAGTYVIYNRVLDASGRKLAITYNGEGNYATATPLSNGDLQKWIIRDFDPQTQSVTPATNSGLQAGWGSEGVEVLPAGNYVWTIRSSDSGYTIKDGGVTVNWGLGTAVEGQKIAIGSDTGNEKQRWILERV